MNWQAAVVDRLILLRRHGVSDFEEAWRLAMRAYPPRASLQVVEAKPTLFDEHGEHEESLVEFFKRVCGDSWYGLNPGVKSFRPEMLAEVDHTEPARRAWGSQGRHRQAA